MTFRFYAAPGIIRDLEEAADSHERDRFYLFVTRELVDYIMREYKVPTRAEALEFIRIHLLVKE